MLQVKSQNVFKIKSGKKIQQTQFYSLYEVVDKIHNSRTICYAYDYDYKKILDYGLKKHFDYYRYIFEQKKITEIANNDNFHFIKKIDNLQHSCKRIFIPAFESRLSQHIKKKLKFNQKQSLIILQQIIEAVYSVLKDSHSCYNIRAENFVKVQNNSADKKQYRFKLETVPFGYYSNRQQNNALDSPFVWKVAYQPPEAYLRQLQQQQLYESIVWSIGCLWVHLLSGHHLLSNEQTIKRFCIGNGTQGVYNFKILGLEDNSLSPVNKNLLIKMLQYKPELRLTSKDLFEHDLFGERIIEFNVRQQSELDELLSINKSFQLRQTQNIMKSNQIHDPFIQQENKFDRNHKILSMDQFMTSIIQIIHKKDLPIIKQEKTVITSIVNRSNNRAKLKQKPTQVIQLSPNIKRRKTITQLLTESQINQQFSFNQIQNFLKPYKFYFDKTIFLAHCISKISTKLTQILYPVSRDSIKIHNFKQIAKEGYEKIFVFRFVMHFMRLIYLQTILQNLKLHQNVFTIPEVTKNIKNVQFDNTNSEWLVFSSTGIYQGLILFISQHFKACEQQFETLIEKQGEQQDKQLSERCLKNVQKYLNMKYKICSIQRFLPYFQMHLKSIISIVDEYGQLHKGYRCNLSKPGSVNQLQNMRNLAYLINALFIESQHIYSPEYYYQLFERFMTNSEHQSEFVQLRNDTSDQLVSKISGKGQENKFVFKPNLSDQIFDFMNYQKFLRWGPATIVEQHTSYLINRFSF